MNRFHDNVGSHARVDFGGAKPAKAREKEPNMMIIDSLLQFKSFLSGEVQENLSLFVNSHAQAATAMRVEFTAHSLDPSYG